MKREVEEPNQRSEVGGREFSNLKPNCPAKMALDCMILSRFLCSWHVKGREIENCGAKAERFWFADALGAFPDTRNSYGSDLSLVRSPTN